MACERDTVPKWLLRKNTASCMGSNAACSSVSPWYVSWLVARKSCTRMVHHSAIMAARCSADSSSDSFGWTLAALRQILVHLVPV